MFYLMTHSIHYIYGIDMALVSVRIFWKNNVCVFDSNIYNNPMHVKILI